MREVRRGEIYTMDLPNGIGSEQEGYRPVVIVSNNIGNKHSPTVIVAPITSQIKKAAQKTHVIIRNMKALPKDSMVLCECLGTFSKDRLERYLGKFNRRTMKRIDQAIDIATKSGCQGCDE